MMKTTVRWLRGAAWAFETHQGPEKGRRLLVSERHHRVDAAGTAGREPARGEHHGDENASGAGEGDEVRTANPVELRFDVAAESQCEHGAQTDADRGHAGCAAQDHPDHGA